MSIQFEKVKVSQLPQNSELLFIETQKFVQLWIWALLIIVFGIQFVWIGIAFYYQLFLNQPLGNKPMSNSGLIFTTLWVCFVMFCIIALFLLTRIETRVYRDGIYFIYFPFHRKYRKVSWEKLDEILGRKYKPLIEFGGWGIRWSYKKWAYTVSGNECIELRKGDYRILIGTKKLNEFLSALDKAQNLYVVERYINS
ncbi:MAG: hypothetical protein ACP5UA_00010 [Candidatus Hydrogenedens sp.]